MKRYLLAISVLPFFFAACGEIDVVTNQELEEDYAIEIANSPSDSDGQIVDAGKTQKGIQEGLEVRDDIDDDLIPDEDDNCPTVSNPYQEDTDDNSIGDACDSLD